LTLYLAHSADWDRRGACFDKLSMRIFLIAMKIPPHPELVEGRTALVQLCRTAAE
jgi:hypothetical protein